jgi:S1-C subfamily serine protease
VKAQLKILSGAFAGRIVVFSRESVQLGRHPSCDLQFDPDQDLEVSARHAALFRRGQDWYVRDTGSLNSTLVNGHPIAADTALDDTDQIRCGPDGPIVEFRLVPDTVADGVVEPDHVGKVSTAPPRATADRATAPTGGTTERIRVEVGRQTRRLRNLSVGLVTTLLLVAVGFVFVTQRQRQQRERDVAALEARTDSLLSAATVAIEALQGQVTGLATALETSRAAVESLQVALGRAQAVGSTDEVRRLRRQLADASQALLNQQTAALVDYRRIFENNQRAVAMLWVEFDPGDVQTGTAFAVRTDGTMLTSRHVVAGADRSRRPRRIAVKFADSYQVYPAQLLTTSDDVDLAVLKVDVPRGVPTVERLNARADTVFQGDPVAIIGFPLGADLPMTPYGRDRAVARTSFFAGSVSKVLPEVIQIDGYGAEGSSGSPIFDGNGEVVGVVYGGLADSDGRIVLGVPATWVIDLIRQ